MGKYQELIETGSVLRIQRREQKYDQGSLCRVGTRIRKRRKVKNNQCIKREVCSLRLGLIVSDKNVKITVTWRGHKSV